MSYYVADYWDGLFFVAAVAQVVSWSPSDRKVGVFDLTPAVCAYKCPWVWYWTPNCSQGCAIKCEHMCDSKASLPTLYVWMVKNSLWWFVALWVVSKIRKALYKCIKFTIRFGCIYIYMIKCLDWAGQYMCVHFFLFFTWCVTFDVAEKGIKQHGAQWQWYSGYFSVLYFSLSFKLSGEQCMC